MPLNKPMMEWFYSNLTNSPADMQDPRLDRRQGQPPGPAARDHHHGADRPASIRGPSAADKLKGAGVQVEARNFDGVTHEFFGMGLVVNKAKDAEDIAVKNLKAALGSK